MKLQRSWSARQICWRCDAERDTYRDMRESAPWRQTIDIGTIPWQQRPPPALNWPGLVPRLLQVDLLHSFHLGVGRTFSASTLISLAEHQHWHGLNLTARLDAAFSDFYLWAKGKGKAVALTSFRTCMPDNASAYPDISCKGADTALVVGWLRSVLEGHIATEWHEVACAGLIAADDFFRLLSTQGVWLPPNIAGQAGRLLETFLLCLSWLAQHALGNERMLYPVQPKAHLLCHVSLDCLAAAESNLHLMNPRLAATWGDESAIGRIARLVRRTHPRGYAMRTLQRHLLLLSRRWRRRLRPRPADA